MPSNSKKEEFTVEDQFKAALKVIQKLPKEGPTKPSYDVMLKFYACYKQATEGPCRKPKPWSFDIINKTKWEHWNKLGEMSKEDAMKTYVDALKEQIDEIPNTADISEFMGVLGRFYNVTGIAPPQAFLDEYDLSSVKTSTSAESFSEVSMQKPIVNSEETKIAVNTLLSNGIPSDEDDFCDSSDVFENNPLQESNVSETPSSNATSSNLDVKKAEKVYQQIENSLYTLKFDVQKMKEEIKSLKDVVSKQENKRKLMRRSQLFPGLSNQALALIIVWPVIAHWLIAFLRRRKGQ